MRMEALQAAMAVEGVKYWLLFILLPGRRKSGE